MKITTTTLIVLLLGFTGTKVCAQGSVTYTVQAWAEVKKSPPSITIRWLKDPSNPTGYTIYRKTKSATTWGTVKGTKSATDSLWIDTDVQTGVEYEYQIYKMNGTSATGVTYLFSGIEVPAVHRRGNCLVVVEKTIMDSLPTEVGAYLKDIAADGWNLYSAVVSTSDSIQKIRRIVKNTNAKPGGLQSLVLVGHVPVPYSGDFSTAQYYPPDGHVPDHNGAWPCDAYYAIENVTWDDMVTNTDGSSERNKNRPGDFKWDNVLLPGTVAYQTGRIDLSNMSSFSKTEVQLTKQYFQKAHNYRYKITTTLEKAVIDENFPASAGGFASTGWRDFSVMFGPKNITESDYFTTLQNNNYLFAYGTGPGSYTSCGGVGATSDFKTKKGAIFNMLFGSYFGDWDNANNFLRAPLAASENGLTSAWSGRPWWQNHHMALGETIGYSAKNTQNNQGTYQYNIYANTVPIALLGDPTLRLHMVAPPSGIVATPQSTNTKVALSWTASFESGVIGYYIYRSYDPLRINAPINATPVTGTTYTDNTPFEGTNYYLVKAVKLTTSASGSYYNLSHGNYVSISGIKGMPNALTETKARVLSVFPNPSQSTINLKFSEYPNGSMLEIYDSKGQLVKSTPLSIGNDLTSAPIQIQDLSTGLYFIKAGSLIGKFIKD